MFYEDNLKFYIQHVDNVENPEIQLLDNKEKYGASYFLYMCHQNKLKYIVFIQSTNILCYAAPQDQLGDIFPEHC